MSVTFVFSLNLDVYFSVRYVMFNIVLSIFVYVAASLLFTWLASVHVSVSYYAAGYLFIYIYIYISHLAIVYMYVNNCQMQPLQSRVICTFTIFPVI